MAQPVSVEKAGPVASINFVRLAVSAVTLMLLYHGLHDIHPFTHVHFSVEVSPCVDPGKPRAPAST
jgi:hypothetical protein